jgi:hypothetical protein
MGTILQLFLLKYLDDEETCDAEDSERREEFMPFGVVDVKILCDVGEAERDIDPADEPDERYQDYRKPEVERPTETVPRDRCLRGLLLRSAIPWLILIGGSLHGAHHGSPFSKPTYLISGYSVGFAGQ